MPSDSLPPDEITHILERPRWEPPDGSKLSEQEEVTLTAMAQQGVEALGLDALTDLLVALTLPQEKHLREHHPDHPALPFLDEARKLGKIE